jgi:predicted enzyme related to lactoylglutathione lyase
MAYFEVDDVDATAKQAKEMGGKLYMAPMSMAGVGRMAVMADPQGAVFSIFKPGR